MFLVLMRFRESGQGAYRYAGSVGLDTEHTDVRALALSALCESGPLRAVHLSRLNWPGGLVNTGICCPLALGRDQPERYKRLAICVRAHPELEFCGSTLRARLPVNDAESFNHKQCIESKL